VGAPVVTELLLDWFEAALSFFVGLFPTTSVDVFQYVDQIASNLGALNYFLPIAETIALVIAVFALFPIFLGVTLSLWVVAQLRGSSSVG
jgi:hypothetical protein